jgi:NAD(P)-dependent dehydrogenase (short-subunit alcohol dehydrogenase family)
MRVFIAGSTGVLGLPLVRELVASRHQVIGSARSYEKRKLLEDLGATAVAAAVRAVDAPRPFVFPTWLVRQFAPTLVATARCQLPSSMRKQSANWDGDRNFRIVAKVSAVSHVSYGRELEPQNAPLSARSR